MRRLDAEFAAHLASGETTLCTCWVLTRSDGAVLGFTDHDQAIPLGSTLCRPASGFVGTDLPQRLGGQVTTAEVLGVLSAESIRSDDIDLGRYDGALCEVFRVNWQAPGQEVRLLAACIGRIIREDGRFRAELRSAAVALNAPAGRVYSALCDAELGDIRCRVRLEAMRSAVTVSAVADRHRLRIEGLPPNPERFVLGKALWLSGARAGLTDRIATIEARQDGIIAGFAAPCGDSAAAGDRVDLTPGCDRRFATCRDVFANSVNFRGFPHVPGTDFVLRLPKAGDALDGAAVVP